MTMIKMMDTTILKGRVSELQQQDVFSEAVIYLGVKDKKPLWDINICALGEAAWWDCLLSNH